MPETPGEPEFHVGLTMSGAISAGAYTAGVFDFLIQALDEWERARRGEIAGVHPASVPNHRVGVKVISGASAGAITAAIGAVALADADQAPIFFDPETRTRIKCFLPKLYEAWVVKPTLVADNKGANDFLTATDLYGPAPPPDDDFSRSTGLTERSPKGPRPVTSLLNSRLLDEVAKAAVDVRAIGPQRPYIAETLHIYLTLTNLRGVPYQVSFEGGDYHMMSHGDRVHYAVRGVGSWPTTSAFSDGDRGRFAEASWLENGHPQKQTWRDFTVGALASAAFPIGLAPRQIYAATAEYAGKRPGETTFRRFPADDLAERGNIEPRWPGELSDYPFMTADGGTIDNDPFEYARFALKKEEEGKLADRNDPNLATADRAVIMISPFPEGRAIPAADKPGWGILSIAKALAAALIDQARFKPSELVLAADPNYASRYLISPKRVEVDGKLARYAIASGLLGGFGGFVARAFRDHDFQLGRRNCQRFLQEAFALPENPLFQGWTGAQREQFKALQSKDDAGKPDCFCIVPLYGTATKEHAVELPDWPRISRAELNALLKRIAGRFDAVAPALVSEIKSIPLKVLLRPLVSRIGLIRAKALASVEASILTDLVRRDQIEGFASLSNQAGINGDDVRLVLAELITPDRSPRSADDVAKAIGPAKSAALSEPKIAGVLEEFAAAEGKAYQVWKAPWTNDDGRKLYALAQRKPPLRNQIFPFLRGAIRQLRRNPSA